MRDGLLRDFSAGYVMHPFAALHAQIAEKGLDGNVDAKEDIGDKGGQMEHQAADQSQGDGKQPKDVYKRQLHSIPAFHIGAGFQT